MKFPYCSRSTDVALHSADAIAAGTIQPPAVPGYLLISSARFCRRQFLDTAAKNLVGTDNNTGNAVNAFLRGVRAREKQSQKPTHTYE